MIRERNILKIRFAGQMFTRPSLHSSGRHFVAAFMRTGSRFAHSICCPYEPNHEGADCDARGGREPALTQPLAVGSVRG